MYFAKKHSKNNFKGADLNLSSAVNALLYNLVTHGKLWLSSKGLVLAPNFEMFMNSLYGNLSKIIVYIRNIPKMNH